MLWAFLAATKQLNEWYFLSVCPSVTAFWLCSHYRIIIKFSGVITRDQGKVHAKGQSQRSKFKVTEVTTQLNRFRTVTPVWIHIWWWNDRYSLMLLRRGALLFLAATKQLYEWYFLSVRPSVRLSHLFSCDQAALWMVFSVRLSVRPSVRPSVRLSHLFDYVPIIVSSWNFQELSHWTRVRSMQKVKVRGQRSRSQRSRPNFSFPDCNSSLNSHMMMKWYI